jgi:uncharacterized protein (DUF3084 family)
MREGKFRMPNLDEIIQHRLKGGKLGNPQTQVDAVGKATEHMKAIKEVRDVAEEISGAGELRKQVKESEEARKKTEVELAEERQKQLQDQIKNLQTEITKLFDQKGPNPEVARLMQQLENTKTELITTRFDYLDKELKELRTMKATGANGAAIDQQIKQIKTAAKELGLEAPSGTTMSPELQVQLKQMDINLQLQLEQMKDDRERKNHEWELTLKKWEETKDQAERELVAKVAVERDKMEFAGNFVKRLGGAFARGTIDAVQETAAGATKIASQVIEAGEGEFGEVTCPTPGCGKTIPIARDAIKAICPNCSTIYEIQRIAKEPGIESERAG